MRLKFNKRFLAVLFQLTILANVLANFEDPYKALGISRSSSSKEIKRAYKNLAKEWHPDKNDSPDASEKFMAVQRAYEVLNDPLRKERFDKFGTFEEDNGRGHHQRNGHFDEFQQFFQGFNGYNYQGFNEAETSFNKHRISMKHYANSILPNSHKKPYLLFTYSSYCYGCHKLEPIWKEVVADLEPLGYGIGTVNAVTERNLLSKLRVNNLPALLVVVDGIAIHFRPESAKINAKLIRRFALDVIPKNHITMITDYVNARRFLDQWQSTNKISVLILSHRDSPRMRYVLSSMHFSNFARFGYYHFTNSEDSAAIRTALDLQCHSCDYMLIFNDSPHSGPVAKLTLNNEHKLQEMEQISKIINHHKFLSLPRIASNEFFDEVCPVSSRSQKQFCIILPVMDTANDEEFVTTYRQFVKNFKTNGHNENLKFSYIFINKQVDFFENFVEFMPKENKKGDTRDILVIWRYETEKGKYVWIPAAWTNKDTELATFSTKLLNHLDKVVSGAVKMTLLAKITLLKNEYLPSWFTTFSRKTIRSIESIWFNLTKDEAFPVISAVVTLIVIFVIGLLLNYSKSNSKEKVKTVPGDYNSSTVFTESWHPDDPKSGDDKAKANLPKNIISKEQKVWKDMKPLLHELRAETYFGMIRLLKPGCRTLVILVDEESKDVLLQQFAMSVWPLRNNKTFSFGYLMVNKNLHWFRKLLEHTLPENTEDVKPQEATETQLSMFKRLKNINPKQTLGTVIVLCGWKLYFSMYHPMHVNPKRKDVVGFVDSDDTSSDEEYDSTTGDSRSRVQLLRQNKRNSSLKVEEVLDGLPNWIDRVLEGSIRRYYIPEWPDNLK
uniref:DnaJ homolog subfamily C member 16 n=1 Tax=Rhabditophanes sp. KR3021 TaxID=114890 RepID=A0AC35U5C2_9BILA